MLLEEGLLAVDDDILLLVAQQHAHHRGLRHKGLYFFADALITRLREDFAIKAGAIVIVNRFYAVLDLLPAESRGVNGKIAALGVAADGKPAGEPPGGPLQVVHRQFLARHRADKAHIEVLFPADEGIIGAAVGHAVVVLLQLYRNGGKLGLAFGIQAVGIGGQLHPLIPRGFNKSPEQIGIAAAAHGGFNIRQG